MQNFVLSGKARTVFRTIELKARREAEDRIKRLNALTQTVRKGEKDVKEEYGLSR